MFRRTAAAAALLLTMCCANSTTAADKGVAAGGHTATPPSNIVIPARVPRITQTIDPHKRATLAGNTNRFVTSGTDKGALLTATPLEHLLLGLRRGPDQEQALQQLIADLHDPASPSFHQWLTADQFGQTFGPAQSDIDTVVAWLQDNGFVVNEVSKGLTTIDFSGTAGQVNAAFATTLKNFDVDGVAYISNAGDPSIPAALSPVVTGIVSLNNAFKNTQYHRAPAPPLLAAGEWGQHGATRGMRSSQFLPYMPEFTYTDPQGFVDEDVAPGDFNVIYNINPVWAAGHHGLGQSVTVIERTRIKAADWTTFRTAFGLSGFAGTFTQTTPAACTNPGQLNTGDQGEAALDAEWASVAAPDANIVLVACKSTGLSDGIDLAVNQVVNSVPAPTIASLSYGQCESSLGTTANAQYNTWWQQAATEGMTVFVSTGDQGAAVCDRDTNNSAPYGWATSGINVSGLSSTPYNVAVGGTDFRDAFDNTISTYWDTTTSTPPYTSAKSYIPEIPWNSSCAGSILLAYRNAHGGGYADSVAYCNSTSGRNLVDVDGGSGGPSKVYTRPSWQGTVFGSPTANVRGSPDVSLFASSGFWGHGLVFCMSVISAGGTACDYTNATDHSKNTAGGTSFAAPSAAGIQALVNELSGQSWGNMNTEFYALAAAQYGSPASPNTAQLTACNANLGNAIGSSCVFNDVTSGDITVPCTKGSTDCYSNFTTAGNCGTGAASTANICGILSTSTTASQPAYAATQGWDFATGLGSLNVANLVAAVSTASFAVTASVNGGNGTITPASQNVASGGTATFTVTPSSGYHVASVTGDTCTVSNTSGTTWKSSAISAKCVVTAKFAIDQFTVTAMVSGGNGTITPPSRTINSGSTATFTVTPNSNYHVASVSGDTCTVSNTSGTTWTSSAITSNCAVTATFALNQFTVTASVSGGNGTITPATQGVSLAGIATLTVTPSSGYHVASVTGDTCTVSNTSGTTWTTSAIVANCAVTATFAIDTFTVTATVNGSHGTITPPSQSVNSGSTATFTVTPDAGYHVQSVTGDTCTVSKTSGTTWSSSAITAACAVSTTFAPNVLVFTTQPGNVAQGGTLGTVVVTEEDGSGNVVDDNANVDFTIAACGGTVDLGSVAMVHGVATLNSSQVFKTVASNLQIVATASFNTANSQTFNVTANADQIFADGFEGCRL